MLNDLVQPPIPPNQGAPQGSPSPGGGGQNAPKKFDITDVKQYFHIVVKRIWLVALCFVVSLAVMVVMMIRQVPVYRCNTTILLSGGLPIPPRLRQQEVELEGDYMLTQQRIIQSILLMQRTKERLGRPASEIDSLLRSVRVSQVYKTSFLTITVDSLDPVFGAEFANALAEEYIDFKAEERMDTSQQTVISLTQQANRLREELKKAEARVVAFEKENKVIAIQERGNIAASILSRLSAEAAQHRTERMLLEAQQPLISKASDEIVLATLASPSAPVLGYGTPSIVGLGGAGTNQMVSLSRGPEGLIERGVVEQRGWRDLVRNKEKLEASITELRTRFHDAHPVIQQAKKGLQEVERELNVELQFALQQYYSRLESLEIQEKAAQRVELEWEDQALDVAQKAHDYENLQRNVTRLQSLYDLVFNRLKEVDISIGIEPETIRIMERAKPAGSPITPRKIQKIFMAALIGLGIGLALVFALEYIDDSIRYPEEVTRGLNLQFFGVIPSASWDPQDLSTHMLSNIDQKSGLAEAYRNVRSSLMFSPAGNAAQTLVITSAVPREGKTTTSLNLAVSLAQAGSRVLLVDADMRRGELHKFFGLEAGRGFSDMLMGQIKPEAVVQRTRLSTLDLVATGPFPSNPAELVLHDEMDAFMEYARRNYDRIIFDCPPLMAVSEAGIICSLVDGVIYVVWAGQTSRKLARLALQVMRERGANVLGCILNNLEFGRVGYYYYSTYYGYYDYDYHYEKEPGASRNRAET